MTSSPSRAGHLTDTLASAYIARQSQIYSAAAHLSSASLSVFGQSSFSTTSTTGDLTTTSSSAAIRNAAAGVGNRTMSAVLAAAVAGVSGAAAASGGRRDGGKGDEGGGGGAAAAGGSIGGGALNQELSDFLTGLDESEKLRELRPSRRACDEEIDLLACSSAARGQHRQQSLESIPLGPRLVASQASHKTPSHTHAHARTLL